MPQFNLFTGQEFKPHGFNILEFGSSSCIVAVPQHGESKLLIDTNCGYVSEPQLWSTLASFLICKLCRFAKCMSPFPSQQQPWTYQRQFSIDLFRYWWTLHCRGLNLGTEMRVFSKAKTVPSNVFIFICLYCSCFSHQIIKANIKVIL